MTSIINLLFSETTNGLFRKQTFAGILIYIYLCYSIAGGIQSNQDFLLSIFNDNIEYTFYYLYLAIFLLGLLSGTKHLLTRFVSLRKCEQKFILLSPLSIRSQTMYFFMQYVKKQIKIWGMLAFPIIYTLLKLYTISPLWVVLYYVCAFSGQILFSFFLFILTAKGRRQTAFRTCFLSAFLLLSGCVSIYFQKCWWDLLPVGGWFIQFILGLMNSDIAIIFSSLVPTLFLFLGITYFMLHMGSMDLNNIFISSKQRSKKNTEHTPGNIKKCPGNLLFFNKEKIELKNHGGFKIYMLKILFFSILSVIFSIGISQITTENGDLLAPEYIIIFVIILTTLLCGYTYPEFGYYEDQKYWFRLIPLKMTEKLFSVSVFSYLGSGFLGFITCTALLLYYKWAFTYFIGSFFIFLSFIVVITNEPFIIRTIFKTTQNETLFYTYIQMLSSFILMLPASVIYLAVYIAGYPFIAQAVAACFVNLILFILISKILERKL